MEGRGVGRVHPGDPVSRVMAWPVAEVDSREPLSQVAEVLAAGEVGAVHVLSGGRLVGVVSERDVVAHVAQGADLDHLTVGEAMTTDVLSVQHDDSVLIAARTMCEAGVRHLPVLSEGGVVGIVSIRDVLGVLAAHHFEDEVVLAPRAQHGTVVPPPWAG